MKTIGIIGGLGPETTAEFYLQLVFSNTNKIARPSILIASVPVPYRLEEDFIVRNVNAEQYLPLLIKEAVRLDSAGADFIVMPCNSLHIFIEKIRAAVRIPVLSIVEETVAFLQENNFERVGIVSTSATKENKLYEKALANAGISFQTASDTDQEKIGKIIHRLVIGRRDDTDRGELMRIINDLGAQTDCVLLACTDLQLLVSPDENEKVVDTMRILVEASAEKWLKNRKK